MAKIPENFMGKKFKEKFNIPDIYNNMMSIEDGELILSEDIFPDLQNLTDEDLIDCVQTQEELDNLEISNERYINAKESAKMVSELKSITSEEAVEWIDKNVENLSDAKTIFKIMVRMIIAMRDQLWSDLPYV